ncbi:hypothetical protein B0H16DRAFT_1896611 [Mycena metata]|uniref:Uncharacterized protein n=1 Tax=Mycena metata TaxID=1033252 RepID=A0AAD7MKM7_9AGAR|nr:hypothetical protein B0H16DRAFT_1896611 [Mycena metata]
MESRPLPPNPDPGATEILVYQNVIAFLSNACLQTSQNADKVQGVQRTLDSYLLSMSSESLVGAIVNSLGHRTMLLELCSQLGLANDPTLRTALRTDGEQLAAHSVSMFESNSLETAVLGLEGDSAQRFMDAVQDALDKGFLMAHEQSSKARRIIRKLSESCD